MATRYVDEFDRAGVTWVSNLVHFTLQCKKCEAVWYPSLPPGAKKIPDYYWHCPNGCNAHDKRLLTEP